MEIQARGAPSEHLRHGFKIDVIVWKYTEKRGENHPRPKALK